MEKYSSIVYQSSSLYVKYNGKYRHVTTPEVFEKMELSYDREWRKYVSNKEIEDNLGKSITEWPEKEVTVGPMRLMYNVPEGADKRRVADMGVTDIFSYGTEWMSNRGQDFLDSCLDEHGKPFIHVVYSLKSSIHDKIRAGETWDYKNVERLIKRFNNHLAVSGYYVLDEPDACNPDIPGYVQEAIFAFIKDRTDKPITLALRGGTSGWNQVFLGLPDYIITNTYPYNGSGKLWEFDEPLDGLDLVGKQQQEYLKDFPDLKTMFLIQCCDEPAVNNGYQNTELPLGKVKDIWERIKPYGINTQGVGFWGYNHGYFGPESSEEMYQEVKSLIREVN